MIDNKFVEKLGEVVKFVFDNEEAFLEKFFSEVENIELICFYMAGYICYAKVYNRDDYRTRVSTVRTDEFVNWVNELSTRSKEK